MTRDAAAGPCQDHRQFASGGILIPAWIEVRADVTRRLADHYPSVWAHSHQLSNDDQ